MYFINPPHGATCDICAKHVSELQPFFEPPYVIDGKLAGNCYFPYLSPDTKLANNFRRVDYGELGCQISSSWECRNRYSLPDDEAIHLQAAHYLAEKEVKP